MAITRVSTAADGSQADGNSTNSSLSPDGTKVIFTSSATNLVPGDTNSRNDIFLKDITTDAVTLVSAAADGTPGNFGSAEAVFSADGTKVAFTSSSNNLVAADTNTQFDVYVKDLTTNAISLVSVTADGTQANAASGVAAFSPDGTKIAFQSSASNLVANDTNGATDIFVKDLTTGVVSRVNTAADGSQAGINNPNDLGGGSSAVFSPESSKIGFASSSPNLVPNDTNGVSDLFVKDLTTGSIVRVSTASDGSQGNGASTGLAFSPDGKRVAFSSAADNFVPNDTNNVADIFVKDLTTGAVTRVSTAADGSQRAGQSILPRFSPDGSRILFQSSAAFDPNDTNTGIDIYEKNLVDGSIKRISASTENSTAASVAPNYSANGQKITFTSFSSGLVVGDQDTNNASDIFVADVPVCFVSGTLILTGRGERAVEDLVVGDLAVTASGAQRPIRWIGHRTVDCARHPRPSEVMPVRIAAGALGENKPARDLFVSPGHSLCLAVLGEVLIPASALVNGTTITQQDVDSVTYWHVELDSHDILIAEGQPAESYLDMGNRGFFADSGVVDLGAMPDADAAARTHGDFCRPYVDGGVVLDAVRAQIQARAERLGWRLDDAPWAGMHLMVDGVRVEADTHGLAARFVLPASAQDVWLVSDTSVPRDIGLGADPRHLGLCIQAITTDDGVSEKRSVSLDDPMLCLGFHACEAGAQRWTAGRSRLPAALFDGCRGTVFLRIELTRPALPRWVAPEAAVIGVITRDAPRLSLVA